MLAMAPLLIGDARWSLRSATPLQTSLRLPEFGRAAAETREPDPGDQRESGADVEREIRPKSIPQPTGEHARDEKGDPRDEVEYAERRAAQIGGRRCGDERGEEPLRESHVESPERHAGKEQRDAGRVGEQQI